MSKNVSLDYVKFDKYATEAISNYKKQFEALIENIELKLGPSRSRSLALTKLEEAYMWIGKSVRDDQIARDGSSEDVMERTNI